MYCIIVLVCFKHVRPHNSENNWHCSQSCRVGTLVVSDVSRLGRFVFGKLCNLNVLQLGTFCTLILYMFRTLCLRTFYSWDVLLWGRLVVWSFVTCDVFSWDVFQGGVYPIPVSIPYLLGHLRNCQASRGRHYGVHGSQNIRCSVR